MKRIVWDEPERVMRYVAELTGEESFKDFSAIGLESDGRLVAGVVFNTYTGPNIFMHVGSDGSSQWMTPAFLAAVFRYPFLVLNCHRVTGLVRTDNERAQRFDEHLGFAREGVLREGASDGCDFIIYGMLKSECRFLGERLHAALLRRVA